MPIATLSWDVFMIRREYKEGGNDISILGARATIKVAKIRLESHSIKKAENYFLFRVFNSSETPPTNVRGTEFVNHFIPSGVITIPLLAHIPRKLLKKSDHNCNSHLLYLPHLSQ